MKKFVTFLIVFVLFCGTSVVYAQEGRPAGDTMRMYYTRLANSKNQADKDLLAAKMYELLKSKKEADWLTARRFFYQLRKNNTADSISNVSKVQFPLGQVARDAEVTAVYDEKNPVKKEKLYQAWVKKFPPAKFDADNQIIYDYARNAVSTSYVEVDNYKKAIQYANMITTPAWRGEGWASTATRLLNKGQLKDAEILFRKAVKNSYEFMTVKRSEPGAGFAIIGFAGYSNTLAEILIKQNRYEEALPILQLAHDSSKSVRGDINANYAKVLIALKQESKAFEVIDEAVKEGQATQEMKDQLKELYVKVKGSNAGYDEYIAEINKAVIERFRSNIVKQMINQPSVPFVLKDVNGKTVSLADYKGKIVVLDFWATWCGPCKRSFPAMKMAVEKYKSNPDVQFLFIHTWEKEENATASAKDYVEKNNFPFIVLMDLKNEQGINTVVTDYKVNGIPTKFVIDKNGNVRFKFTGFSGSDETAVEELSIMIEMVQKG